MATLGKSQRALKPKPDPRGETMIVYVNSVIVGAFASLVALLVNY